LAHSVISAETWDAQRASAKEGVTDTVIVVRRAERGRAKLMLWCFEHFRVIGAAQIQPGRWMLSHAVQRICEIRAPQHGSVDEYSRQANFSVLIGSLRVAFFTLHRLAADVAWRSMSRRHAQRGSWTSIGGKRSFSVFAG
jgi:hypothetical protein